MSKPAPIVTRVQPLTRAERQLMEHMEIRVRAVFGGWEAFVIHAEADESDKDPHTRVRDSALAAYIDGETLWYHVLDLRLSDKEAERMENAQCVEAKSGMPSCHGGRL